MTNRTYYTSSYYNLDHVSLSDSAWSGQFVIFMLPIKPRSRLSYLTGCRRINITLDLNWIFNNSVICIWKRNEASRAVTQDYAISTNFKGLANKSNILVLISCILLKITYASHLLTEVCFHYGVSFKSLLYIGTNQRYLCQYLMRKPVLLSH